MERILFVYAKLNPGIRYVQGMNEVLAPIFHVMGNDNSHGFKGYDEHDTFFCFTNLMSEIRDLYIKGLDSSSGGLRGQIDIYCGILERHDPELKAHLDELQVNPQLLPWYQQSVITMG